MGTFILICALFVFVSTAAMITYKVITKKDVLDSFLSGMIVFITIMVVVIGLIFIPSFKPYKIKYIELTNFKPEKTTNSVFLDLTNCPEKKQYHASVIKFDSYDIVSCYNDSIKFFIKEKRSYYNLYLEGKIV